MGSTINLVYTHRRLIKMSDGQMCVGEGDRVGDCTVQFYCSYIACDVLFSEKITGPS